MFRLLLKIGIILTIVFIATFYYFPLSQGQSPESPFNKISEFTEKLWNKIKRIDVSLPKSLPKLLKPAPASKGSVILYRWQDANGQWHFSNTPPDETNTPAKFSTLVVDTDANVIQSIESAPVNGAEAQESDESLAEPDVSDSPNPYSPDAIKKLFEQTESIRDNMQQRQQIMQELQQTNH